jgi:hypothetical protein
MSINNLSKPLIGGRHRIIASLRLHHLIAPGIWVHLAVEDQAGLLYNQECKYDNFKEIVDGRGSGEVNEMVYS